MAPFKRTLWHLFQYGIIAGYFFVWSYKTEIRHKMKVGSLGILSLSTVLLMVEIVAEAAKKSIHEMVVSPILGAGGSIVLILFFPAVAYLIWHHWGESRKPGYEYKFVRQLCQFLRGRQQVAHDRDTLVSDVLPLFWGAFERAGIRHCSVHLFEDNTLKCRPALIHPRSKDPTYYVSMEKGEGVAGKVYVDSNPRYVPRIYLPFTKRWRFTPTLPFDHAVKFVLGEKDGKLDLVSEDIDPFAFKKAEGRDPHFRSLVSVPLTSITTGQTFGVLNFDFNRHDPLDKIDIAMAVVFGLVLGDEIERGEGALEKGVK